MPPVRVAVANDYEIVVAGIVGLLAPFEDRVEIVELAANKPVASDVDVVLYDTFGQVQGDGFDLRDLLVDAEAQGRGLHLEPAAGPDRAGARPRRLRLPLQGAERRGDRRGPRGHPCR